MQHDTQGLVAAPRRPTREPVWRGGGANAWQSHKSSHERLGGATWQEYLGLADDGPSGIVGPG